MKLVYTILFALLVLAPCKAQELTTVLSGDRVRVLAPALSRHHIAGNVISLNANRLVLKSKKQSVEIHLPHVQKFEIANGKKSNIKNGAGFGFLIGAAFGALMAAAADDCSSSQGICFGGPAIALAGGIIAGGIGSCVGAFIGFFIQTDKWEEVPIDRLRLGFSPQPKGRLALSASVAF